VIFGTALRFDHRSAAPVATTLCGGARQHFVVIMSRRVLPVVIVIAVFCVKSVLFVLLIVAF